MSLLQRRKTGGKQHKGTRKCWQLVRVGEFVEYMQKRLRNYTVNVPVIVLQIRGIASNERDCPGRSYGTHFTRTIGFEPLFLSLN